MENIAKELCSIAANGGRDTQMVFNEFLDYIIDCFSIDRLLAADCDYHSVFTKLREENNVFFPIFASFLFKSVDYIKEKGIYDFFGNIYEKMFQGGGKAARMGQFFTPQEIANLCAEVSHVSNKNAVSNEPTCGSGRNILALFGKEKDGNQYYIAEDLDSLSVKMCAINMLIHGMRGRSICHNTLFPDDFIFGYEINEVRYPFPTQAYSIRSITKEEYLKKGKK